VEFITNFLNKPFGVYNIKGIYVEPTYWMAGVIILLAFLLIFTLARIRYLYVHWNLGKSAISMLFWGFFLAIIFEAILVLSGRTLFTEILGWQKAPKPISTLLEISRAKVAQVMGVSDVKQGSENLKPQTYQSVLEYYENLPSYEKEKLKTFICEP